LPCFLINPPQEPVFHLKLLLSSLAETVFTLMPILFRLRGARPFQDSAKVFSGYLDGLVIRTFKQKTLEVFAKNSTIPVINGLTDMYHPCQILSDLFTLYEIGLLNKSLKFTYLGDCNNVLNSLLIGFAKLGIDITVGCLAKYGPLKEVMEYTVNQARISGSKINIAHDPVQAVTGSNVIYTDVWISMGDEDSEEKIKELSKFKVNSQLLLHADKDVRVMHCLPAHREQEITSNVLDGKSSIVWQQAENRLYAQKGGNL